jgi:hypothetical protein
VAEADTSEVTGVGNARQRKMNAMHGVFVTE